VPIGTRDGDEVRVPPQGTNLLLAGPSGSGKSRLVTALLERLAEREYQLCLIDPEGEYEALPGVVHLGSIDRAPTPAEVLDVLEDPTDSVAANLLGLPLEDRPSFFEDLLGRLQRLHGRTGRPHRLVVEEAHHLMPADWQPGGLTLSEELEGLVLVAAHLQQLAPAALSLVDVAVVSGPEPASTLEAFGRAVGEESPRVEVDDLPIGKALAWWRRDGADPFVFEPARGEAEHRRHLRKYAEGELGEDRSFWFRGPQEALNLRARNLQGFLELADGVDDATWLHHLRRGDYSRWIREKVKDAELAAEAEEVERDAHADPRQTRARLRQAVERRYTAPAQIRGA
jgi:energy-coupling factor transporter ATP-binding protein EcfA2